MCLAVPFMLIERTGNTGRVAVSGGSIGVDLSLAPDAKAGDYVLVHAGFAIAIYSQQEAAEIISLWREIEQ